MSKLSPASKRRIGAITVYRAIDPEGVISYTATRPDGVSHRATKQKTLSEVAEDCRNRKAYTMDRENLKTIIESPMQITGLTKDTVCVMLISGVPSREVAERLGVNACSVNAWARRLRSIGLSVPKQRTGPRRKESKAM